jgi:murein L,D-transpeptidase YcbB/YkuD
MAVTMRSETPVFIGEMRYVEFSPYWNVPPTILRNEILPLLAMNPAYLEQEDMEVVNGVVNPRHFGDGRGLSGRVA